MEEILNAIRTAADNGNLDLVKLLLTDPRTDPEPALEYARMNNHHEITRLLKDDNLIIRQHKITLKNKIRKLKVKLLELQKEEEAYIQKIKKIETQRLTFVKGQIFYRLYVFSQFEIISSGIGEIFSLIESEQEKLYKNENENEKEI